MQDRNQKTLDGEPLVDRGTIESRRDEETQEMEQNPPVDETDSGPQPVLGSNDAEPRNTNQEKHPTIAAEDAKDT